MPLAFVAASRLSAALFPKWNLWRFAGTPLRLGSLWVSRLSRNRAFPTRRLAPAAKANGAALPNRRSDLCSGRCAAKNQHRVLPSIAGCSALVAEQSAALLKSSAAAAGNSADLLESTTAVAGDSSAVFEHSGVVFESAKAIPECSSARKTAVAEEKTLFTVTD